MKRLGTVIVIMLLATSYAVAQEEVMSSPATGESVLPMPAENYSGQVYREGALPARVKEMLGLVASLVLRCDDCIKYHTIRCHEEGVSIEEMEEALSIGLIVGGSIVIPHLRRAFEAWDELVEKKNE